MKRAERRQIRTAAREPRRSRRTKSAGSSMWMSGVWAAVLLALAAKCGSCLRQQTQTSAQQLLQAAQQPLELSPIGSGQVSYETNDYSPSLLEGLMNLGQPVANSKRARKMSAFMPMRGRKDGRDAQLESPDAELLLTAPIRETDGDASIMRLVASLAAGPEGPPMRWLTGPRQFANQLAARRLLLDGPRFGSLESVDGGQFPATNDLMQAKPRRAFHPMRGKKSLLEVDETDD